MLPRPPEAAVSAGMLAHYRQTCRTRVQGRALPGASHRLGGLAVRPARVRGAGFLAGERDTREATCRIQSIVWERGHAGEGGGKGSKRACHASALRGLRTQLRQGRRWSCCRSDVLLADLLVDERLVDVRDDTAAGDGGLQAWGRRKGVRVGGTGRQHATEKGWQQVPGPQHAWEPATLEVPAHLDEGVQLLVTADGQLQVARRDALHLRGSNGHQGRGWWAAVVERLLWPQGGRTHAAKHGAGLSTPRTAAGPSAAAHQACPPTSSTASSGAAARSSNNGAAPLRPSRPAWRFMHAMRHAYSESSPHLKVLRRVARQLQHLGGQVLCGAGVCES